MPIISCRECGGNVSDQATSCPHCGVHRRSEWLTVAGVVKLGLALVGGIGLAVIVLHFYYKNLLWN